MCGVIYLPLQYHIQQFQYPKNPLCFTHLTLPYPELLASTDLVAISRVLPFPECHIDGMIQCVVFLD